MISRLGRGNSRPKSPTHRDSQCRYIGTLGGAIALFLYYLGGTLALWRYLRFQRSLLTPRLVSVRLHSPLFRNILRIGVNSANLDLRRTAGLISAVSAKMRVKVALWQQMCKVSFWPILLKK